MMKRDSWLASGLLTLALAFGTTTALAQTPAQSQAVGNDYKLHAGDKLAVSVWKEEELKRDIVIRPDGKISFPLTGEVQASGRSIAQVQLEIESKLKKYMSEPIVTVSVLSLEGNQVFVIGQVNRPGAMIMNPQLNILQALALAGGMTAFAAVNDIIVIRGTGSQQKTLQFRYNDISRGKSLDQNLVLESGDVVIVP
jgi:polysaccharide export outer membrane protein